MKDTYFIRTVQWIVMIILVFFGPLGWVLIYLLWKQWNPAVPVKLSVKVKAKKANTKQGAKTAVGKKGAKK